MHNTHLIYLVRKDSANPLGDQRKLVKRCTLSEAEMFLEQKFDSYIGKSQSAASSGYVLSLTNGTRTEQYIVAPIEMEEGLGLS